MYYGFVKHSKLGLRLISDVTTSGVVHANVGQKLLNRNILSNFLLTDLVFVTLLLCDATNFRSQSTKRSQLY